MLLRKQMCIVLSAVLMCSGQNLTWYYRLFDQASNLIQGITDNSSNNTASESSVNSSKSVNSSELVNSSEPVNVSEVINPLVREANITLPELLPTTVEEMLEGNQLLPANDVAPFNQSQVMRSRRQNLVRGLLRRGQRRKRLPDGTVRLVNGELEHEGNVEVWHKGKWGSICDDEWDMREAQIVCQQLGYPGAAGPTYNGQYGHARPTIWMDNLACSGEETELKECRFDGWGTHDCSPSEAAGVVCAHIPTPSPSTTSSPKLIATPKPQKISSSKTRISGLRVAGGRNKEEGRVEILVSENNDWKCVCGDGWSLLEAGVICRELGLGYAISAPQTDYFGGKRENIILNGVKCNGQEESIKDCYHTSIGYGHCPGETDNVAGVVCSTHVADLIPDHLEIMRSAHLEDRQLFFLSCALEENCVGQSAYALQEENSYGWHLETRRLLRFTARIANIGNAEFRPFLPKNMWEWHACHMHYHSMEVFANYDVTDEKGNRVAEGHKASFCLEDADCKPGVEPVYNCENFGDQGISVGCTDTYKHNIDCQWVDMTDVEPGNYMFKVAINPELKVGEQRFDNNAATCNLLYTETYAYVWNCTLTSI